jgi:hypothetical protein
MSRLFNEHQEATLRRSSLSLTTAEFTSLTENDKSSFESSTQDFKEPSFATIGKSLIVNHGLITFHLSVNWDGLLILTGDTNIDLLKEKNQIVRQYNELLQYLSISTSMLRNRQG